MGAMLVLRRNRDAATLLEFLVVIGVISILLGLLLSAVQKARGAATRLTCQNKLKQLALGLHGYHDQHDGFPPGHRGRRTLDGLRFTGWPLDVLPFIEQTAAHSIALEAFRRDANPFHNPPHQGLATGIPTYSCPEDGRANRPQWAARSKFAVAFSSYLGVSGRDYATRDGLFFHESRAGLRDVIDGTSATLLLGERPPSADFQYGWWYAGIGQRGTGSADMILGVRERNVLAPAMGSVCPSGAYSFVPSRLDDQCGMFHFWSLHVGGANFAFADGSVHFLAYSANSILPQLASRAGGEVVEVP